MTRALYSPAFESAWKSYGRHEEKRRAFAAWTARVVEAGDEGELLASVTLALAWQAPMWAEDGWTYAPYFERYLKRHKDEDEPPPPATGRRAETFDEIRRREQDDAAKRRKDAQDRADASARAIIAETDKAVSR